MQLPAEFLASLSSVPGFDQAAFEAVHQSGQQVTSIRLNKNKKAMDHQPWTMVNWCSDGFYLPERPYFTHDPLLHAGVYYVQEASSMFLSHVMKQVGHELPPQPKLLDLCAAPGGKSTLLLNEIGQKGLLVSNEIIKSRVNILEENLVKWGMPNVVITNNDPKQFSSLDGFFDVMLVDAPCSGSGLFRRDKDAIDEWSLQNVKLCSQRQQRIIADAWTCLKQDGLLIYSTCSYSAEEDEEILDWIADNFQVENQSLHIDASWGIVETSSPKHRISGYRFYPDKVKGEGFFISCIRKKEGGADHHGKPRKTSFSKTSKAEKEMLMPWVKNENNLLDFYRHQEMVFAFPKDMENELALIGEHLFIRSAGIRMGTLTAKELIPEHALAVSTIVNPLLPSADLDKETAIRYLKKEEIRIDAGTKGWLLVKYDAYPLGWIKALPNRVNNYYPKEWRILK